MWSVSAGQSKLSNDCFLYIFIDFETNKIRVCFYSTGRLKSASDKFVYFKLAFNRSVGRPAGELNG